MQINANTAEQPKLLPMPIPTAGECFRSLLSRYAKSYGLDKNGTRRVRNALLTHCRSAGLDVNLPAAQCIAAIEAFRTGAQ